MDADIVQNVELGELSVLWYSGWGGSVVILWAKFILCFFFQTNIQHNHIHTEIHMYMYTNYILIFDTEDEFICRFWLTQNTQLFNLYIFHYDSVPWKFLGLVLYGDISTPSYPTFIVLREEFFENSSRIPSKIPENDIEF